MRNQSNYTCSSTQFCLVILLALVMSVGANVLNAQIGTFSCGTDVQNQTLESQDNSIATKRLQSEKQYVQEMSSNESTAHKAIFTLPIVFHIIHDNGIENISDNQVINALDWLNAAFANTAPYGPDEGVDTEIEFCLANQDPDGNPTNGINRVQSPLTEYNSSIDDLNMKNLIRWDPLRYVNVWIVREISNNSTGTSVAGYAYFPSSHGSAIDGIAIEASAVGVNKADNSVFAHEMGHYLGLYHTFQGGCFNNNCLTDGDRVCDTPPDQSTDAVPCGLTSNSCSTDVNSGFTTDQDDMNQNFMDYNTPACLSQFTAGQKDRMFFFLNNDRQSLLSSEGCASPCMDDITVNLTFSNLQPELNEIVNVSNNSTNVDMYTWFIDGNEYSNAAEPDFSFNEAGIYEIILLSEGVTENCFAYDTIYLEAACRVEVGFTPAITDCIELEDVPVFSFDGSTSASVEWYLDDDLIGTGNTINPTFNPGPNIFTVSATSSFCTKRFTQVIFISCNEICGNGFDDDNDGLIDCFDTDCCGECDEHYYDPCFSQYEDCADIDPITAIQKWEAPQDVFTGLLQVGGDIDNDGTVEIIAWASGVNRYIMYDGEGNLEGYLGPNGTVGARSAPVLADVDNDGFAEIISINNNTEVMCLEHTGAVKYRSAPGMVDPCCLSYFVARCQVADLNYDGVLEVVVGNKVLNAQTGDLIVDGDLIGASEGYDMESNGSATGNITIANIFPDDDPLYPPGLEIVTANQILTVDFNTNTMNIAVNNPANQDSWGVAVDLDHDGDLDVLSPRNSTLTLWEGQDGTMLQTTTLNGDISSLPTICNLDDDPELEIVVGHRNSSSSPGFLVALNHDFSILWEKQVETFSLCNPVSFDFENDGKCEIVHRTDVNLYIIDGMTGDDIFVDACSSGTANEHPTILDIDSDGHAEIVVGCSLGIQSDPYRGRVRAYEGRDIEWAFTRPVWNQASFYNTHVRDDLSIPAIQQAFYHPHIEQGVNSYMSAISYSEEEHFYDLKISDLQLNFDCELPQTFSLSFDIINNGLRTIEYTPTETIYSGNPNLASTEILQVIQETTTYTILPYDTLNRVVTYALADFDIRSFQEICLVINDLGEISPPFDFPIEIPNTAFNECDFSNNMLCLTIEPVMEIDLLDDDFIFCEGGSITMKPEGIWVSYLWSDGTTNECLSVNAAGEYWLEVLNNDCVSFRDTFTVVAGMDNLVLDLPDELFICNNTVSLIEAQEGFATYVWQDGFTEPIYTAWLPGVYTVTVTNSCGESFTDQTEVLPLELSLALPDTITICDIQDTTIIAEDFEILETIPETGSSCVDCNEVILSAAESQWFYLYAFDINDCMVFDSIYLRILDEAESNDTIYFCPGDTVFFNGLPISTDSVIMSNSLDCEALINTHFIQHSIEYETQVFGDCQTGYNLVIDVLNESGPIEYEWADVSGFGNSLGPVGPGIYTLTLTYDDDCMLELDLEVESESGLVASVEPCYVLDLTQPLVINIEVDMNMVSEISWTPAIGLSCDDCPDPLVSLETEQAYDILITDLDGCTYPLETKVVVDFDTDGLILPNAFSPNGDGTNDFFEIEYPFTFSYDLSIYDRWGNVVYTVNNGLSNDPDFYWDGKMNGQFVETGVYVVLITIEELALNQTGTITVLR